MERNEKISEELKLTHMQDMHKHTNFYYQKKKKV